MDASDDLSPVLAGFVPKELHFDEAMLSTSATSSCLCVCDANSMQKTIETIKHMSYVQEKMDEGEGVLTVAASGNSDDYADDADETLDEAEAPIHPDNHADEPMDDEANEAKQVDAKKVDAKQVDEKQVDAKQVKAKQAEPKSAPIPTPARGHRAAAKKSAAKPGKTNKTKERTSPAKPMGKFGKGKTTCVPKAKATPKKKAINRFKDDVERKLHCVSKLVLYFFLYNL
jgi:hypothetical protein